MKKIEVKLYFYHDIDLVSLYRNDCVSFPETTRKVLKAYANKEVFKIKINTEQYNQKWREGYTGYRKFFHYYVSLDEKEDKDVIELMNRISPGYRNNFVKTVLRQYICCELPPEYVSDGDFKYLHERSEMFAFGREEICVKSKRKPPKAGNKKKKENRKDISADSVSEVPVNSGNTYPVTREQTEKNDDSMDMDMMDFLSGAIEQY